MTPHELFYQRKFASALALIDKQSEPSYHEQLLKGACLTHLNRPDEASAHFEKLEPSKFLHWHFSFLLSSIGQHEEALAMTQNLHDHESLFMHSMQQIGLGHLPEGWDNYRNRTKFPFDHIRPHTIDEIKNNTVVLMEEGGYGDILMFVRYAILLKPLVNELYIAVPSNMIRLMMYFADEHIKVIDNQASYPPHDLVIPVIDCPGLFRTTIDDIYAPIPYFNLPPIAHEGTRIGLVWRAGSHPTFASKLSQDKKSMSYEQIEPLVSAFPNVQFVNLQKPDVFNDDPRLEHPISDASDFLDTANVIQGLDIVVTICSSVAHLAGAMGKPVILLLQTDCCFRWFWVPPTHQFYQTTLWYPTMRLIRQPTPGDWKTVIDSLISILEPVKGTASEGSGSPYIE